MNSANKKDRTAMIRHAHFRLSNNLQLYNISKVTFKNSTNTLIMYAGKGRWGMKYKIAHSSSFEHLCIKLKLISIHKIQTDTKKKQSIINIQDNKARKVQDVMNMFTSVQCSHMLKCQQHAWIQKRHHIIVFFSFKWPCVSGSAYAHLD